MNAPTPTGEARQKPSYSFEEFRMMYQSTELVSDRKIGFTRANSSLCMAMIAGQGICANWAAGEPGREPGAAFTIILISVLGIIFCRYWHGQLLSFKDLNTAKFRVLEEMADQVVFPDYSKVDVRSKNPFMREYEILQGMKRLSQSRDSLIQTSTLTEMMVPKGFMAFFGIAGLAALIFILLHLDWTSFSHLWRA